ncbi:hypothetical protein E2C01_028943 [Portunus trituberculatus]|uniref:Uncharacterized protein n=1 Tax=Portunus trituberculatus TaxID=210409 RepID=A0A5B7EQI0_PORTR|nr:hypothetical protein [Portunus trituberculatus]
MMLQPEELFPEAQRRKDMSPVKDTERLLRGSVKASGDDSSESVHRVQSEIHGGFMTPPQ